jgi:FKBP-type peptidyl-prolyl cis-trans isomerase FkpA
MRMISLFKRCLAGVSVVLLAAAAGCAESATAPTNYSPFAKTDIVIGTGDEIASGQSATVNYTGWLYDVSKPNQRGPQFDSSVGGTPFTFVVGANPAQVIRGWDQGVPGMRVGGVRQLIIPPSLAYGDTRRSSIPANATLVFEIELVSFK